MKSTRGSTVHGDLATCIRKAWRTVHGSGSGAGLEASSGTALHLAIEKELLGESAAERVVSDFGEDTSQSKETIAQGARVFLDEIASCGLKIEAMEKELIYESPTGAIYSQRADAIAIRPDGLRVLIDWKTTSRKPDALKYTYTFQNPGYWFLGEHTYGRIAGVQFWAFSWEDMKLRVFPMQRPSVTDDFRALVEDLDKRYQLVTAAASAFDLPPTPGFHCNYCSLAGSCWAGSERGGRS